MMTAGQLCLILAKNSPKILTAFSRLALCQYIIIEWIYRKIFIYIVLDLSTSLMVVIRLVVPFDQAID